MKHIFQIAAILLVAALLTGCTTNTVNTTGAVTDPTEQTIGSTIGSIADTVENNFRGDVSDDWEVRRWRNAGTFSDEGYYYTTDKGFLYFYDLACKLSVRLCSDVNCLHEEETRYEVYENCEAFIGGNWMLNTMFLVDETLYYINVDYYGTHLFSRDSTGLNEKKVASLAQRYWKPSRSLQVNDAQVRNGTVYYTVDILGSVWNEEELTTYIEREFSVICCMDLKTGKEKELIRTANPQEELLLVAVSDDAILYSVANDVGTEDSPNVMHTVVLYGTDGQGSRILMHPNTNFANHVDVHDGVFYFEEKEADGTVSFVGYDLLTSEVVSRIKLPAENYQYLSEEYRLNYAHGKGTTMSIYNIHTGALLDGIVGVNGAVVVNVDEAGFVLKVNALGDETIEESEAIRIYYCAFASLEDGFQLEDLHLIHIMDPYA